MARLGELCGSAAIIHGGAAGPDIFAYWAALEIPLIEFSYSPDWKKDGKRAGFLRNLQMLDLGADFVIAWWDGKSRGTKHTIDEARKRGIPVEVHEMGKPVITWGGEIEVEA